VAEREKPILLNISLCDVVIRDQQTHKLSLINLFNELQAASFPCTHPRFYVYVCLTNGRDTYEGSLSFIDTEQGKVLAKVGGPISFHSPLQVVELSFELNAMSFPRPGIYRFEFACDHEPVGARNLRVVPLPEPPPRKG
jgi:hypothetical protein